MQHNSENRALLTVVDTTNDGVKDRGLIMRGQHYCSSVMIFTILFLSALGVPFQAVAEKTVNLYIDSQLVLDQSDGLRQQAAESSLRTIFIRVSGNTDVVNHPLLQQALAEADTFLEQYRYVSTDESIIIAGDSRPARRLELQFSSANVQRVLREAGLPIWPADRLEILLWTASEVRGNRQLVDADSAEVIALKAAALQRGLPIFTPSLDLSDRQRLSAARIWVGDEISIINASARYSPDAVLAGRLFRSGTSWSARFTLLLDNNSLIFNESGASGQAVAQKIISRVATYLASVDAIIASDKTTAPSMTIVVEGVSDFVRYARLINTLNDMPVVANVMVSLIEGDNITLNVSYNGTESQLRSALKGAEIMRLSTVSPNISSGTALINATNRSVVNPTVNTPTNVEPREIATPAMVFIWQDF